MVWFHADYYAPDAASQAAVKAESLGPLSAADLFLVMLCRWTQ